MPDKKKVALVATTLLLLSSIVPITQSHTSEPIRPVADNLFRDVPEPSETDYIEKIVPSAEPLLATPVPTPKRTPRPVPKVIPKPIIHSVNGLRLDREVSWYGPGFYGKRTACGLSYTKTILGVANKTLPCGTKVTFSWKGRTLTVPVIDRGPYVAGRQWDLSGGLCVALHHCFTGPIYYKINNE